MAIVQSGQASEGIKLFGTTIMLYDKERKEEKNESSEKRGDKIIACPRCKSMETKFCYFNNYNVNQPRHFCKGCQRYWTAGGTLRNVPVGAGRRKTKLSIHDSIGFLNVQAQPQFSLVLDEWNDDFHHQILSSKKLRMNSTPHGHFC